MTQDTSFTALFDSNTYSITVLSGDTTMGSAQGSATQKYLTTAIITATPNYGYHFTHWSDGSTTNPYSFTLTQDTVIEAYFVPEVSEGVNDVEVEKVVVRVQDGQIVVGNAMGETIRIFDEMGRCRNTSKGNVSECIIPIPAAGVYLVQVGNSPAQRVVVAR